MNLENYKELKKKELKEERDLRRKLNNDVYYKEKYFDYDEESRKNIINAIISLTLTGQENIEWVCADDTFITLTCADLKTIVTIAFKRDSELEQTYYNYKRMVDIAQTFEEVNNITWSKF